MKKSIKVFGLAIVAIGVMIYMGVSGISVNHSSGPFFIFVGTCTAIGLTLDIINHIKARIRRNNIRKLGF